MVNASGQVKNLVDSKLGYTNSKLTYLLCVSLKLNKFVLKENFVFLLIGKSVYHDK